MQQGSPYTLPPQYAVPSRQQPSPTPPPVPPKAPGQAPPSRSQAFQAHPAPSNIPRASAPAPVAAGPSRQHQHPGSFPHHPTSPASPFHQTPQPSPPVPPPASRSLLPSPGPNPNPNPNSDSNPARPPSRPSSSSSWSSDGSAASAAASTQRIAPSTPRRRILMKGRNSPARAVGSPRRTHERERERTSERTSDRNSDRDTQRQRRPLPNPPADPPTIYTTLTHLLAPVRVLLAPLQLILGPIWWHLFNTALLVLLAGLILWGGVTYLRYLASSLTSSITSSASTLPLKVLATPACLLTNTMCGLSLLSSGEGVARPFWKMLGDLGGGGEVVDVAAVSRELSTEVRHSKDIFDSLMAFCDGRMAVGLESLRIAELGVAIKVGSTLEERFVIGNDLLELSDITAHLRDEVTRINAISVTAFSWLLWHFQSLAKVLALPPSSRPTPAQLEARIDRMINALDADLDALYGAIDPAIDLAAKGTVRGRRLFHQSAALQASLRDEKDRFPGWQKAVDVSRRFLVGGDPSKRMRIVQDLEITGKVITGIAETSRSLDRVKGDLTAFSTQVRALKGSVMGLHYGAGIEVGLGPEEEMEVLMGVVEELGAAVGRAKVKPEERRAIEA